MRRGKGGKGGRGGGRGEGGGEGGGVNLLNQIFIGRSAIHILIMHVKGIFRIFADICGGACLRK